MRMTPQVYYRTLGARYLDRLMTPHHVNFTSLPRGSVFHYVPGEAGPAEVESEWPIFQGYSRKIELRYIIDYVKEEGGLRRPMFNLQELTRKWRRAHKQRWEMVLEDTWKKNHNPESLIVLNYGYLDVVYKYLPLQMREYHRWLNRQRTVMTKVAEIARVSDRQQFFYYPIPPVLQGRTILDKYSVDPANVRMAQIFGQYGPGGFMQLDLWKWLSVKWRDRSLLGMLEPSMYPKINLVFVGASGDPLIVNLGYLNSWIKGQPNMTEFGAVIAYDPIQIQKIFLKMCMMLNAMEVEEDASGEVVMKNAAVAPLPIIAKEPEAPEPQDELRDPKKVDPNPDRTSTEAENIEDLEDDESEGVNPGFQPQLKADLSNKVKPVAPVDKDPEHLASMAIPELSSSIFADLEKDMEALDRISLTQLKNTGTKLSAPSSIDEQEEDARPVVDVEAVKQEVFVAKSPAELLAARLEEDAEANLVSAADYRKMRETTAAYLKSEDPYGSKQPRVEAMQIVPRDVEISAEEAAIPVSDAVPDKTMAASSLQAYDRKYVKHVLKKDILKAIDAVQGAGVAIRRHEIDVTHSVLGSYEHHTLEIKPIDGAASTIKFTFPKVEEDGTFLAGGNKYLLRKQRVDNPLRKIAPRIVSLSSYYGKTFVQTNDKVVNDSLTWLYRQINEASLQTGQHINSVNPGNVYDHDFVAPYIYNAMAQEYETLKAGDLLLNFNKAAREGVNPELLKIIEKNGRMWCGWTPAKAPIVVDRNNEFFIVTRTGQQSLGSIYDVLKLDTAKCPMDFAEIRIYSKYVPVGIVLSYYIGFSNLIGLLGAEFRVVEGRKQKNLQMDEFAVTFKDESYIFKKTDPVIAMVLSGFNDYEKVLKLYERKHFETKDVYLNLLETKKMKALYIRELDMMLTSFIDPITKEILETLKQPTTFVGLILAACRMLTNYNHPASQDRAVMRDRGYERFAGILYKELMKSIRDFRNKNLVGRSKINISPYEVWNAIMKDNALKIVEDTNPIQNLKEMEVVTYSGTGGRDKDTMTKPTRAYHKNDLGITSESTVDNSAVGTIVYLSANPNLGNLRGLAPQEKQLSPTSIMSTAALISPASMNDLPKRITFINTQHSHTIASPAYKVPYVRTGYELVLPKRTSKMFSTAALDDGKVTGLTEKGIIVTYKSGETSGIELGRVYGKAEGTTYPFDIVTPMKLGQSFKKGDILAYNSRFFEPDFLNPKDVILKVNRVVNTVLMEANLTHEDSCALSEKVGGLFQTEVAKVKSYIVDFKQNLLEVKKPGEKVEPKDVLMIIEDEITSASNQFSEDALSTLKRLQNVAPRASVMGTIDKIEVFYHGDKRDMSPTLKKLADRSDSDMSLAAKSSNRPIVNGQVTEEYRVNGTPLELDKAEVKIYINVGAGTGVGDKAVFGHQMKCTVSEVLQGKMHTEEGEEVDAIFSYRSVAARGVLSPAILGTTITLLDALSRKAAALYFGEK